MIGEAGWGQLGLQQLKRGMHAAAEAQDEQPSACGSYTIFMGLLLDC